jgi:hypothetical protein
MIVSTNHLLPCPEKSGLNEVAMYIGMLYPQKPRLWLFNISELFN